MDRHSKSLNHVLHHPNDVQSFLEEEKSPYLWQRFEKFKNFITFRDSKFTLDWDPLEVDTFLLQQMSLDSDLKICSARWCQYMFKEMKNGKLFEAEEVSEWRSHQQIRWFTTYHRQQLYHITRHWKVFTWKYSAEFDDEQLNGFHDEMLILTLSESKQLFKFMHHEYLRRANRRNKRFGAAPLLHPEKDNRNKCCWDCPCSWMQRMWVHRTIIIAATDRATMRAMPCITSKRHLVSCDYTVILNIVNRYESDHVSLINVVGMNEFRWIRWMLLFGRNAWIPRPRWRRCRSISSSVKVIWLKQEWIVDATSYDASSWGTHGLLSGRTSTIREIEDMQVVGVKSLSTTTSGAVNKNTLPVPLCNNKGKGDFVLFRVDSTGKAADVTLAKY